MTTIRHLPVTCRICGKTSTHTILGSSNTFGSPDLDLRPAPMLRSTMHTWIQRCPHCGYCSPKISDSVDLSADFLKSEKYLHCNGINFASHLAESFFRHHLICLELNKREDAAVGALRAAWVCDDISDAKNAVLCRLAALGCMNIPPEETDSNKILQTADIMRRAGLFDAVIRTYSDLNLQDALHRQLLEFQLQSAKEKDSGCYTVKYAVDHIRKQRYKDFSDSAPCDEADIIPDNN